MKKEKPLSVKYFFNSFKYAFEGLKVFFHKEHNAVIHLAATIAVIFLGIILPVTQTEIVLLIIVTGFVWFAEIINTAIEKMMDFISPGKNPRVKAIKDLAAASVLIAAITAFITGCIIFIPKLL